MEFWVDKERAQYKSYEDLIFAINEKTSISKYIYCSNPYDVVIELLASLAYGVQVEILDGDFSLEEIKYLGIKEEELAYKYEIKTKKLQNIDEYLKSIKDCKSWSLTIYTSGTTGRPKKVQYTFESLTRNIRHEEYFKKNIWAFAYNLSHFAGLQVFLQAFLNKNPIIYLFESNRINFEEIMNEYSCTHISATPTFYRNIIPYIKEPLLKVSSITMGGEKFDNGLVDKLRVFFPSAKIHNIYASTEAGSLFSGCGEYFEISEKLKPLIKISENSELLLHKSLVNNLELRDEWYNTKDIVELVGENRIRFLARSSDMINVGGYKINPLEIEEEIQKIDGVIDVAISSRENKLIGNLLIADIIKVDTVSEYDLKRRIVQNLNSKLQKFKIPRIINFVEKIEKTRTGKKVRT